MTQARATPITNGPADGTSRWRRPIVPALGALGVLAWIMLGRSRFGGVGSLIGLGIAVVVAVIWLRLISQGSAAHRLVEKLREPVLKTRLMIAGILSVLAAIYFLQTAVTQGRQFGPVLHDEHCYIIQTRMLAQDRLWMPRHELADFFDSFHLITDRVYASKYGPGTAIFGVPAIWAGLEPWITPLILTSLSVGLFYLMLAEMTGGLSALLGALMLPALSVTRRIALEVLSEAPMLFLLLLAVWAFIHWRRRHAKSWLIVMSAAAGWGAITRPSDTLCLAIPLLIGMMISLRALPWRNRLIQITIALAAVAPFFTLQLISNKGITGHLFELPWTYYGERNDPYDTLSNAPFDPSRRTQSIVPEIVKFQDEFTRPAYQAKLATPLPRRLMHEVLQPTLEVDLPNPLMLILVPIGLIALAARGRWVLGVMLLLFLILYARHTFFLLHYAIVVAPAIVLLVLLGWRATVEALPPAARRMGIVIGGLALAALTITAYPQFQAHPSSDEWAFAPILRLIDDRLSDLSRKPAIVLFHFDNENGNPHIEPVYNTSVAWPDDATVIRAHDLGAKRNQQLYQYYARQKVDRAVYLFDLSAAQLREPPRYLGTARELAGSPR
jgi:4-amino-4-deoxy-L-arabinose transferase-like glycosyltransferase